MANYPYFNGYYPYNGAAPDMMSQQKMQYQPMIQQPNFQSNTQPNNQPTFQMTSNNDRILVLGEIEAQSFPVMPGNSVTLWDKDGRTFYFKEVNTQGVPSMRIFDYTERGNAQQAEKHECKCSTQYVSLETFNALEAKFQALTEEFQALSKPKKKIKEDTENV